MIQTMKNIALIGLIFLVNTASALELASISTSPAEIGLDEKFYINAYLIGDSCSAEVKFYVDGRQVGSKAPGCGRNSAESNVINPSNQNLECGMHAVTVELFNNGALEANTSKEMMLGNQPELSMPEKPEPGKETVIGFIDRGTGEAIEDLELEIEYDGESKSYRTNSAGNIEASFRDYGKYTLTIDDEDYCGTYAFQVREGLKLIGPTPEMPYAGESFRLETLPGIAVKALNKEGKIMAAGASSAAGLIELSISEAGTYTLVAAEGNDRYWGENKTINVLGKGSAEIRIAQERPSRGKEVAVQLLYEGAPIEKASVTIEEPSNETYAYETDGNGTVWFTPALAGVHIAGFEDARFNKTTKEFIVKASLSIDYMPKNPKTEQDITVYVKDDLGNPVQGASVSVGGVFYGFTGGDAGIVLRLSQPGRYQITSAKEGYWDAAAELSVISPLSIEVSPKEPEYGEKTTIKAYDANGKEVSAAINVTAPDGSVEGYAGSYSPKAVGRHIASAEEEGFVPAEKEFTVKPMPLELSMSLIRDRLIINTSSRGNVASGITLVIEKASGTETVKTDSFGKAEVLIKKDERIKVSANTQDKDPKYGELTVVRNIVKRYDPSSLIFALSAIAVVAIVGILIVYLVPKIEGRRQFDSYLEKKTSGKGRQTGQDLYKRYHEPYFRRERKSRLSGK